MNILRKSRKGRGQNPPKRTANTSEIPGNVRSGDTESFCWESGEGAFCLFGRVGERSFLFGVRLSTISQFLFALEKCDRQAVLSQFHIFVLLKMKNQTCLIFGAETVDLVEFAWGYMRHVTRVPSAPARFFS